jgi:hypothetical protein
MITIDNITEEDILKLAEFCALIQGGRGIESKAPSYIAEKIQSVTGNGGLLDSNSMEVFKGWKRNWLRGQQ